ncbi:YHYH protein [Nitratireductor sp. XY-223]|uniref:YHYH protein n=1 Tax=Nitratireductor sp. XY-223 TaxID=2561926 RepID=UPI0010AAABD6|nr:YHYH protein [Nitratireductor sp. XY-223]
MTKRLVLLLAGAGAVAAAGYATAASNRVEITQRGNQICIRSNSIPNHATGQFPNRGNPHRIRAQNINVCVDANPKKTNRARGTGPGAIGIALNGVLIRPGTADYWDPRSPRGHSRDRRSGWNLEGMGSARQLGIDSANAHVDNRGTYHYHGRPVSALKTRGGTQIGYAADGFEIHYIGGRAKSGYRLKKGSRPSGPGGKYDGSYVEDWVYVGGAGTLDQCNGGMLNGKYVYFATNTYPFYPRCFFGRPSPSFRGL